MLILQNAAALSVESGSEAGREMLPSARQALKDNVIGDADLLSALPDLSYP
jgi:hypothetical protein